MSDQGETFMGIPMWMFATPDKPSRNIVQSGRENKGMTIEEAAEALDMDPYSYGLLELDASDLPAETIFKLAKLFGFDPMMLAG